MCEPATTMNFVNYLLEFIDAAFNEPVLGYLIEQQGAVFVDARISKCADRMLYRGTGGDAQRGRLLRYAAAQCLSYYAMARLFGWRVYTVPYTSDSVECDKLDGEALRDMANEIGNWFDSLKEQYRCGTSLPSASVEGFPRANGTWDADMSYARAVSIYK